MSTAEGISFDDDSDPVEVLTAFARLFASTGDGESLFSLLVDRPIIRSTRTTRTRGPMTGCFSNAFQRSKRPGEEYVEGLALATDVPVPVNHAWVSTPDGVLESTWDVSEDNPAFYVGLVLPRAIVVEFRRLAKGKTISLLDGQWAVPRKWWADVLVPAVKAANS